MRVDAATTAAAAADAVSNPPNNADAASPNPPNAAEDSLYNSTTTTTNARKKRSIPFGARVELDDVFTKWNLPDRGTFPASDPEINAIMSKYNITVPDAKTELGHGIVSGKSGAVSSYKVPICKLREWRPDIAFRVEALIDTSSPTKANLLQFWTNVAGGLYLAAIENFAYCAEERDKKARKYQSDIIHLREKKAKEWCELMESIPGGLAKVDAHPFFTFAFYFMLQQFTYMAKYGGEDDDYQISVDIDNFDIITNNAKTVLYYLAGWIVHGIETKQVAKDLIPIYKAFKANNSLDKAAAEEFGLPTHIVEQRRKREGSQLIYSGPTLHKFLLNIEAVYRRHGNQKGFDRFGGKLFQVIERVVLDNEEMYQKFLNCLGSVVCTKS